MVSALEMRFAARGWKMSSNNIKQADVISGSTILPNPAERCLVERIAGKYDGCEKIIILLPGPPHEMRAVFDPDCMERLRAKIPPTFIATRVLKITGIGESHCDARVAPDPSGVSGHPGHDSCWAG